MLFFWKKAVSPLFLPLSVSTVFLVLGLVLLWTARRRKAGRLLVSIGTFWLLIFAYSPVPDFLARCLEQRHMPVMELDPAHKVGYVAVLGGGSIEADNLPATARLRPVSAIRLLEGIRLYHGLEDGRLIVSGGTWLGEVGSGPTMAEAAEKLGIPAADLTVCGTPRDTEEEAEAILPIVGEEPFLMVTSAAHMPRAMLLFERLGMHPIPAPVDYSAAGSSRWSPEDLYPSSENLTKADNVIHEYLGILWAYLLR